MKATQFMRRPFIVAGFQVTEKDMDAIAKWCQGHVVQDTGKTFIRVPVDRVTNKRQTEAYVGSWVLLSYTPRGDKSFKVYTQEWLDENFIFLTGQLQVVEIPDRNFIVITEEDEDEEEEDPEPIRTNPHLVNGVHRIPRPPKSRFDPLKPFG